MKPTDICECGDYRSQHDKNGKCRLCGDSTAPGDGCVRFRFHTTSPDTLDRIADRVLAYRPKPKTKAAKRRKRRDQYAKRRRSESSI
jgi:hypothetical protein